MRLDILMEYNLQLGRGIAALRWIDPMGSGSLIQLHLVALFYGRILCVHKETRAELFDRVGNLAVQNVRTEGSTGFHFTPWVLRVGFGGGDHNLWPWRLVPSEGITDPKIYAATLKFGEPTSRAPLGRWIDLKMALGQERVLAPSSALIAIAGFSRVCGEEARYVLALLLWQMNVYWGSPDRVSLGTEALAHAAAEAAIRSGQLRIP